MWFYWTVISFGNKYILLREERWPLRKETICKWIAYTKYIENLTQPNGAVKNWN